MRCLHFTNHPDGQLWHIRILQIRQIPLNILYGLAPAFPCKYGILKPQKRQSVIAVFLPENRKSSELFSLNKNKFTALLLVLLSCCNYASTGYRKDFPFSHRKTLPCASLHSRRRHGNSNRRKKSHLHSPGGFSQSPGPGSGPGKRPVTAFPYRRFTKFTANSR